MWMKRTTIVSLERGFEISQALHLQFGMLLLPALLSVHRCILMASRTGKGGLSPRHCILVKLHMHQAL